ncbi:MAG: hypothetical protein AVDCRST_MAG86-2376 [uncultured Truepera sp.]|uniref:Uncharacterized protein n=1 Tax=uncultured Truepera sp. TaxID=543023 RepID=A0A6J4VFA8_9DEIN|nr:MAG: hypothetical protein AVDCRST_MAG86-2376 [uncultured Truepera sp.]
MYLGRLKTTLAASRREHVVSSKALVLPKVVGSPEVVTWLRCSFAAFAALGVRLAPTDR